MTERILYAQSVHDETETAAVLSVLRGGPLALKPGPNVAELERQIAADVQPRLHPEQIDRVLAEIDAFLAKH